MNIVPRRGLGGLKKGNLEQTPEVFHVEVEIDFPTRKRTNVLTFIRFSRCSFYIYIPGNRRLLYKTYPVLNVVLYIIIPNMKYEVLSISTVA